MYWPCGVPQVFAYHGDHYSHAENNSSDRVDSVRNYVDDNKTASPPSISHDEDENLTDGIVDLTTSRQDHLFATLSRRTLELWSSRPTVVLANLVRSDKSLATYGHNVAVFFKSDASDVIIQTSLGYLIIYSLESEVGARVLQQQNDYSQTRRQSVMRNFGTNDAAGLNEILLRFRRAVKIDAGISTAVYLDHELVVSTIKPAAVQCIKWESHNSSPQAIAQLLSKMDWLDQKYPMKFMVHDRAMNLSVWVGEDGSAYAVQRIRQKVQKQDGTENDVTVRRGSSQATVKLFDGFRFHVPQTEDDQAMVASINARFSVLAISTVGGRVLCYTLKDYAGNIPLSHEFVQPASLSSSGALTTLQWSPDGYCLFAGYQKGWTTWSVYGKSGASTFHSNSVHAETNDEQYLLNITTANWSSGGSELLLTSEHDKRIWKLELARSAAVGCFSCSNLVRALLQLPTELAIYQGHDLPDLTSISNEASLWHHAQYPPTYLHNQWPIKSSVVSQDGRYVAIAGRRGLAHYSVLSGRWKTFSDSVYENSFAVRGGMCWFSHVLAAAVERQGGYELRLYSRDHELGRQPLQSEMFSFPIAFIGPSGEDSLLVYTYENTLYHYIINYTTKGAYLTQVGQIAFHGVVRAPSRVRSVSWVLPDTQLRNGDPSQDVSHAAVLFLVDDKLVLFQPSKSSEEGVKYDMRVVANHVEYYILMRDQIYFNLNEPIGESVPPTPSTGDMLHQRSETQYSLRDSLWIFVGEDLRMWMDVRELLRAASEAESASKLPLLSIPVDFYPLSILMNKAVILGIESEMLQRRDVSFAQFRTLIRTQLLLPYILRYQLCDVGDTAAAFGLAHQYQNLSYFPHALEILLHHILDDEVDRKPGSPVNDSAQPEPLPAVLSFLQMVLTHATYLATVVQCIRKTEVTSWKYLFAHLPAPLVLFEQALELKDLKTASGYLIVLQGMEDEEIVDYDEKRAEESQAQFENHVVRIMTLAKQKNDYELCSELARFMMGIDPRGMALKRVVEKCGFKSESKTVKAGPSKGRAGLGLEIPRNVVVRKKSSTNVLQASPVHEEPRSAGVESTGTGILSQSSGGDYFSSSPGNINND